MAPKKQQDKGKGKAAAEPLDQTKFPVEQEMPLPRPPRYFLTPAARLMDTDAYRVWQERKESGEKEEPVSGSRRTTEETATLVTLVRGGDDDPDELIFVNVGEVPAGFGVWHWLEPEVDGVRATELGLDHPAQVEHARNQGFLGFGLGENAGPVTVWYPRSEFFNPRDQPEGPGRWAFHTADDRDAASTNLGGQADAAGFYNFTNVPHPTAAQVWAALNQHLNTGRSRGSHRSREINIVWVPGTVDDETSDSEVQSLQLDDGIGRTDAGQIDENSGLVHDPLNRGENDQTAPDGELATYHTMQIGGKIFTLDRTRVHAGPANPRLAWIVTKKGFWTKYSGYNKIDWTKEKSVESLNRWKEQALSRNGWPNKRQDRPTYPENQREWMMDYVKDKERTSSSIPIHELAVAFKERFGQQRADSGLYGLMHRIHNQLKKHGGFDPDRQRRGDNLKRKRGEGDDSESEGSAGEGSSRKAGRKG